MMHRSMHDDAENFLPYAHAYKIYPHIHIRSFSLSLYLILLLHQIHNTKQSRCPIEWEPILIIIIRK